MKNRLLVTLTLTSSAVLVACGDAGPTSGAGGDVGGSGGGIGGSGGATSTASSSTSASSSAGSGGMTCAADADCATYDDGDLCNGIWRCTDGACAYDALSVVTCDTSGDTSCAKTRCDPQTGACVLVNEADGTFCNDDLFCTTGDTCKGGVCKGAPLACGLACQVCSEAQQACVTAADACLINGTCFAAGELQPFYPCHQCDPAYPDDWSGSPAGTSCSTNDACYPTEQCDGAGLCKPVVYKTPPVPSPWFPHNGFATGSVWAPAGAPTLRPTLRLREQFDNCVPFPEYDIQVDDSCTTGDIQACSFPSPEASTTGLVGFSWKVPADLPVSTVKPVGRRYYWRVRACRMGSCSDWSRVQYLDVGRVRGDLDGDGYSDLVVSSPFPFAGTLEGAVYVYPGGPAGVSTAPSQMLGNPGEQYQFGWAVAVGDLNGDGFADLVVGAPSGSTKVFVYLGAANGLATMPSMSLPNPGGLEGKALSAQGDLDGDGYADLVASTWGGSNIADAIAYIFPGSPSGLAAAPSKALPVPILGDSAVAYVLRSGGDLNGDGFVDIVAGDVAGLPWNHALVFKSPLAGAKPAASTVVIDPAPATTTFARAIALGDLDGDGIADLTVGDSARSSGVNSGGRVYFYPGSQSGIMAAPSASIADPGDQEGAEFGRAVDASGDINGDGRLDLVVGARGQNATATIVGRVFVHLGTASGPAVMPAFTLDSPFAQADAGFGGLVQIVGDVNGDGHADVAVAASDYDGVVSSQGAVLVYLGAAAGLPASPSFTLLGPDAQAYSYFGFAVAH